jgi:hypothetical protein
MKRNFLFVLTIIACISSPTVAQVPDKAKVAAGADRAWCH